MFSLIEGSEQIEHNLKRDGEKIKGFPTSDCKIPWKKAYAKCTFSWATSEGKLGYKSSKGGFRRLVTIFFNWLILKVNW